MNLAQAYQDLPPALPIMIIGEEAIHPALDITQKALRNVNIAIQEMQKTIREQKEKLNDETKKRKEAQQETAIVQTLLEQSRREKVNLQHQLDTETAHNERFRNDETKMRKEAQREMGAVQELLAQSRGEKNDLQRRLDDEKAHIEKLCNEVKELSGLRQQLAATRHQLDNKIRQLDTREIKLRDLERKFSEKNKQLESFRAKGELWKREKELSEEHLKTNENIRLEQAKAIRASEKLLASKDREIYNLTNGLQKKTGEEDREQRGAKAFQELPAATPSGCRFTAASSARDLHSKVPGTTADTARVSAARDARLGSSNSEGCQRNMEHDTRVAVRQWMDCYHITQELRGELEDCYEDMADKEEEIAQLWLQIWQLRQNLEPCKEADSVCLRAGFDGGAESPQAGDGSIINLFKSISRLRTHDKSVSVGVSNPTSSARDSDISCPGSEASSEDSMQHKASAVQDEVALVTPQICFPMLGRMNALPW